MPRYLVHGYYTDEPQVTVDLIDADDADAAEAAITKARGGKDRGYVCDGADDLEESYQHIVKCRSMTAEAVAADVAELADNYKDDDEEEE
jgi:hypothetical protein